MCIAVIPVLTKIGYANVCGAHLISSVFQSLTSIYGTSLNNFAGPASGTDAHFIRCGGDRAARFWRSDEILRVGGRAETKAGRSDETGVMDEVQSPMDCDARRVDVNERRQQWRV